MLFLQRTRYPSVFKNKHLGERCFIMGTGPSLHETPLGLLSGEKVFGVNNCHAISTVKFSYFCVTDHFVWNNQRESIIRFVGQKIPTFVTTNCKDIPEYFWPLWRRGFMDQVVMEGWGDIEQGVYCGHTVIIMCLQIAFYMGFSHVYLIGCDSNYEGDHHFDGTEVDNILRKDWSPVFRCYEIVKDYYFKNDRSVFNSTVGGKLEVFPRVDLRHVL